MNYRSRPLPLDFWVRLLARLNAEFETKRTALTVLMRPKSATVDSAHLVTNQVSLARQGVFDGLHYLEQLQALMLTLANQSRLELFKAGILDLDQRIACLQNVVAMFRETMCGLPSRTAIEQELQHAVAQYDLMQHAGHSEAINAERQRLCAVIREMPVVGSEDSAGYEVAVRTLQTSIDQMEADRQHLNVSTLLSMHVPGHLASLLAMYGVEMAADADPGSPELAVPASDGPAASADPSAPIQDVCP